MKLILIGIIIGIGKIIPGVSGAMLAISFGVYEQAISRITNFFNNPKENLKFLLSLGVGILLAIILGSKLIIYLLNTSYFITLMFFMGLIISSIFSYGKQLKYNFKSYILIILVIFFFLLISFLGNINTYQLTGNVSDLLIFFLGGIIEIFSSLVPGISGTALLMLLGIYEQTLILFSSIYNINFVLDNLRLYISYGLGMIISFILVTYGLNYLFKKKRSLIESLIMGFTISSIILLFNTINFQNISLWEYLIGGFTLIIGYLLGNKGLEKN